MTLLPPSTRLPCHTAPPERCLARPCAWTVCYSAGFFFHLRSCTCAGGNPCGGNCLVAIPNGFFKRCTDLQSLFV